MSQAGPSTGLESPLGSDEVSFVDESNLAKHIDWLERAVLINLDHRTRYANDPEKYHHHTVNFYSSAR